MGSNISLSGIKANNNGFAEATACLFNQPRVFYSGCTQNNPLDAGFKQLLYCFQLANASTHLGGNQYGTGYLVNNIQITEFTAGGAIKVNDM